MTHAYYVCDVFTDQPYAGNPLAVVPDATGLSDQRMQQIAREFNLSETTFVLPSDTPGRWRVRIFTPAFEVPFAGHPNIGTAFVLAASGRCGDWRDPRTLVFEEQAGEVPVTLSRDAEGMIWGELEAPEPLRLGETLSPAQVAPALGLSPEDIRTEVHAPQIASVGLPFLIVEAASANALRNAAVDIEALRQLMAGHETSFIHVYQIAPQCSAYSRLAA